MRSLTARQVSEDRDRGSVLVLVGVMMTVLLGVGALTVDLGALYDETRQLQNGSDAGALAIAQSCAGGSCAGYAAQAQQYANSNAKDNTSAVDVVCGVDAGSVLPACSGTVPGTSGMAHWVKVTTSTRTTGGGTEVPFVLAPIMNSLTGSTARRTSVAAWGILSAAVTSPLTFSACEFTALGGSLSTGAFPSGTATIVFHSVGGALEAGVGHCTPSTSNQDLPGGFGKLANVVNCTTTAIVSVGDWVPAQTGGSAPNCDLTTWQNTEILISVYDQVTGTGSTALYHIIGFVGFTITGYRFPGTGTTNRWPSNFSCPGTGNSTSCVRGQFTRVITTGSLGGTVNLGAQAIKMVG